MTGSKTTNWAREGTLSGHRRNEHEDENLLLHRAPHWSVAIRRKGQVGNEIDLQPMALPDRDGRELVQKSVQNPHRGLRQAAAEALPVGVRPRLGEPDAGVDLGEAGERADGE